MSAAFRHRLRVRYHECDPQGIVFNANYLAYADIAITELYRDAFGAWQQPMGEHAIDMVVAAAHARFLAPARFDDELDLVAVLTRLGETSTATTVRVERAGELLAEVELRHVVIDAASREKRSIPEPMRDVLEGYREAA